jgi:hypothetical protein
MRQSLGWTLQFLALVIVGTSLLVGLVYGALRLEVAMLGVGGALFLTGRWLEGRD